MKKSKILFTSTLAMLFGLGVAAGVGASRSVEAPARVRATESITSRLVAKLDNAGKWSTDGAKLAAYLTDDTNFKWTGLQNIEAEKQLYVFDYTVDFTPTKLIWVRLDASATEGDWAKKHNQTGDLAVGDATYLPDEWDPAAGSCSQWPLTGNVYTSKDSFAAPKATFGVSTVELVEGGPQVSGVVTLEKDEEFKVVNVADNKWSAYYDCPAALSECFTGGSKEHFDEGDPNIVCKVAGTYRFYFNTETKKIWISNDDIVAADGYAGYFLSNVGCDPTGVAVPTGWTTCATQYATLSGGAKDYLCAAEGNIGEGATQISKCVYWYDYAIARHPSLVKFMVDSKDAPRAINSPISMPHTYSEFKASEMTVIIVATTVTSLAVLSLVLLISKKRRKHQ